MMHVAQDLQSPTAQPQKLQAILQQIVKKTGVPGISAALLHEGRVTSAAAGLRTTSTPSPMCADSRFALASVGKFLICAVAMESIASHQLDRDVSIRAYLPELADSEMGNNVALWHLMSHTSGCYQGADGLLDETVGFNADWVSVVQRSIAARRLFVPGAAFSYDTPNYVLCGEILRRLHGAAPRDLIRTRILDPLGIDWGRTDFDMEKPGRYVEGHIPTANGAFEPTPPAVVSELWESASSSLTLSMPDFVAIAASIMGAPITTGAILSAAARRMLLTQVVDLPIAPEWPIRDCALTSYGFGCAAHRNGLLGHPGEASGQCCALHFDPVQKIAVAVGVNARAFHVREAALTMLMRLMGYSSENAASKRVTFAQSELLGDYVGGAMGRVLQVRAQGPQLICQSATHGTTENGGSQRNFPVARFHMTDEGYAVLDEQSRRIPLCFFREPGGTVPCLIAGAVSYRQI